MIRVLRKVGTACVILPAIGVFLAHGFLITLSVRDLKKRRQRLLRNVSAYSRFALRMMRVQIEIEGRVIDSKGREENALFISNHLSYLDMLVLAAVRPAVFVTSVDMGQVPFLGTMAEIGGSLFIERRNRERIDFDISQIESVLRDGFDVVLFPEGTSSNGACVLPFKKPLLASAVRAQKAFAPLTLQYTQVDGAPLSERNRDRVCWYGAMSFLPHLISLFECRSVRAVVTFHERVKFSHDATTEQMALALHAIIGGRYGLPFGSEAAEAERERIASARRRRMGGQLAAQERAAVVLTAERPAAEVRASPGPSH